MKRPRPRGPLSGAVLDLIGHPPVEADPLPRQAALGAALAQALTQADSVPEDEDLQLTLHVLYALHLHGYDDVDDAWEWDPHLAAVARALEGAFEAALRRRAAHTLALLPDGTAYDDPAAAPAILPLIAALDLGPSLSTYVATSASLAEVREFLVLRSIYLLKEADPHTLTIPRLRGRAKAALVEIQGDEYGGGREEDMHSTLFAQAMRAAGLDDTLGAYIDAVPAAVLAADNAAMLFGCHRRLRAASVGHLAALEMTSSLPMARYARGMGRVGLPEATAYFLEHVEVDAVHEQVALYDMVAALLAREPALLPDVLLGVTACLGLDAMVAADARAAWAAGRSALRRPVRVGSGAQAPYVVRAAAAPAPRAVPPRSGPATIQVCPDGPLLVRGDVAVVDTAGEPIAGARRTSALCRCGGSGSKPWCDGSHRSRGVRSGRA